MLLALLFSPVAHAAPREVLVTGRYSRVTGEAGTEKLAWQVAAQIDAAVPVAAAVTGAADLSPVRAKVYANRRPFSTATGVAPDNPIVGLAVFPEQVIYLDGSGSFASLSRVAPHEVGHVLEYRAAGPGVGELPLLV